MSLAVIYIPRICRNCGSRNMIHEEFRVICYDCGFNTRTSMSQAQKLAYLADIRKFRLKAKKKDVEILAGTTTYDGVYHD